MCTGCPKSSAHVLIRGLILILIAVITSNVQLGPRSTSSLRSDLLLQNIVLPIIIVIILMASFSVPVEERVAGVASDGGSELAQGAVARSE